MRQKQISELIRQSISMLLVIVSLTVTFTSAASAPVPQDESSEVSATSTENAGNHEGELKLSDAIQSHFQVNLTFQSFLLDVVSLSIEKVQVHIPANQFIVSQSKSFKILLRQFISANAP
jgi:hypothetical protein